ncbi:MAG: DUF2147 domain-containing protein [Granulosicoccus sp.]
MLLIVFSGNTVSAADQGAIGIWQTESSDQGYLHVSIQDCDNLLCGTIVSAYNLQDEKSTTYEHLGKTMVWDMDVRDKTSWAGGRIWDPGNDKTYKSRMSVKDDILSVSGCVLMFCRTQEWTRVQ